MKLTPSPAGCFWIPYLLAAGATIVWCLIGLGWLP